MYILKLSFKFSLRIMNNAIITLCYYNQKIIIYGKKLVNYNKKFSFSKKILYLQLFSSNIFPIIYHHKSAGPQATNEQTSILAPPDQDHSNMVHFVGRKIRMRRTHSLCTYRAVVHLSMRWIFTLLHRPRPSTQELYIILAV